MLRDIKSCLFITSFLVLEGIKKLFLDEVFRLIYKSGS